MTKLVNMTLLPNTSTLIVTSHSRYTDSIDIEDLNHQKALLNIPGILFSGVLATIGVIGNALVLYIYTLKIRPSNHRVFIIFLAALDFNVSAIGVPLTMYEQIYPLMQHEKWVCKMKYTVLNMMMNASNLILLVIAGDRYRKVCKPLKRQMSITQAKVSCAVILVINLIGMIFTVEIFGLNTVHTNIPGLTGTRCYIDNAYIDTRYFVVVSVVSISYIYITFTFLSVLYYFVILKIKQQTKKMKISGGESTKTLNLIGKSNVGSSTMSNDDHHLNGRQEPDANTPDIPESASNNDKEIGKRRQMETYTQNIHGYEETTKPSASRRTTLMLLTITIVFFVSYTPFLILQLIVTVRKDFEQSLGPVEYSIFNITLCTFYINNMANPIIYGFCDKRFMKQMKICCACAHNKPK